MMRSTTLPSRGARTGCSMLALATVLVVGATPASAQSFLGAGTPNNGAATTITTGPGTTTISVTAPQTVIDWVPTDNAANPNTPINFQNSGTSATFLGNGNYAVLNNIAVSDLSRVITMNGTITAGSLGNAAATGSIYFYSPSGFLLGGNSIINVGSLVLSASPITVNGNGSFITGLSNSVTFGQAPRATASIVTSSGSQINANGGDAYVAMVAPRVQHGGAINVAGSAALVGAEAATINFSPDGLFDIQVTSGTTDGQGVSVSGSITGAASTGAADVHRAYLVAVPKNAALTMLIANGSSLGFNIAGAANVVGNTVVLSAGYNITDGAIGSVPAAAGNGFDANLLINGTSMTSGLVAAASGNADIFTSGGALATFASDVTVYGVDRARVGASGVRSAVTIAGDLDLSTVATGRSQGEDVTAGLTEVYALQSGRITVSGTTTLDSSAFGGSSTTSGVFGGDATGGTARVTAQTGGGITLTGALTATADGHGGQGNASGADGGVGTGGVVDVRALDTGSVLTIQGGTALAARGFGGSGTGGECFACDGDGGNAFGGDVFARAQAGGQLNLQGASNSFSTGATGGTGGRGPGGNAFGGETTTLYADGAGTVFTISGEAIVSSNARGGDSDGGMGGDAIGGNIDVYAQNGGSMQFDNALTVRADGTGGSGATGGGDAEGGTPWIYSYATLQVDGALTASANAVGGELYNTDFNGYAAGNAVGGALDVFAQNGTLTLVGAVQLSTDATGGRASDANDVAGDGTGGRTRLFANTNGTIDLQSSLDIRAIGTGGGATDDSSSIGGDGLGGAVRVQATSANASITIADEAILNASGRGSDGSGGNGTGGTAWADSFGAPTASLDFLSNVYLYAQGRGGDNVSGNGGNGRGGQALLQASAGSSVSVAGDAVVNTDAFGGYSYDFSEGVGGNAIGGQSRIQTFGGTGAGGSLTATGSALITATATGGASYSSIGGTGGSATGGTAHLITTLGNIQIGAAGGGQGADVTANGIGGNSDNGSGGNGTGGGFARIEAVGGDIAIEGFASVSASGIGGNGVSGGDGLGSGTPQTDTMAGVGGAHIYARNGDVTINGGASVASVGIGGSGSTANSGGGGGGGQGLNADGDGPGTGGSGGNGTGGWATIHAANSDLGPSSINIDQGAYDGSGTASIYVYGVGGNGGDGPSGNAGGNGGNGGDGEGGTAIFTAAAGNGTVRIGVAQIDATARGGDAGHGGSGDGEPGGNGGTGGSATGGYINVGTESGSAQSGAVNNGLGSYGSIIADSSALGGLGGDGGFGSSPGSGGDGGSAVGGGAILLVRGSLVEVDTVTLTANATGGNGGQGDGETSPDGNGGNATIGGSDAAIGVLATNRFLLPAQRGSLDAGSIEGSAIALGGSGSTDGISQTLGGNGITFSGADGDIGSLSFVVEADRVGFGAIPDFVVARFGQVVIDGDFSFVTSGRLSLFLDNANLTADTIVWSASDFVADAAYVTPALAGTFFANSFDIQTGNNFITTANLNSVAALAIDVPGRIAVGNVDSEGNIDLIANGDVRIANGGNIAAGRVQSDGDVVLLAEGSIATHDILATDDVSLEAGGSIGTGDITGRTIDLVAGGAISTDDLLTRIGVIVIEDQLDPGASITLRADGNIGTGAIESRDGVVAVASDGSIATGRIGADDFVELTADGGIATGNIIAGDNIDIFADGGPVALGTLITPGDIAIESGGALSFGNVSARLIDFEATGAATGGNIVAVRQATGEARGAIVLGDVLVTGQPPIGDDLSAGFASATSIRTGNVSGTRLVGFATLGNLTTGNLNSGSNVIALVGGNAVIGSITTQSNGRVYLADDSMYPASQDYIDFGQAALLARAPVATGGSITINGAVSTGRFQAAAGTTLATRAITANSIEASTTGNATIDGLWRSPSVSLRSGNIDVTANGGINAGSTGSILLNAVNSQGALIGDGLTGTGYALSNAEFGRISGGGIRIVVGGNGGDADTLIGDLTITGPLAGSNISSNSGGVEFVTVQQDGRQLDGMLRVVGDVMATGLGADNYIGFYTQNFELDATTGTISLTGNSNVLAGTLELYATRIHVAETSLLAQLAVNPQFAGYREALNRPAAVARPEGVIRAANFDIEFGGASNAGAYSLLVQNMGTTSVRAGFVVSAANIFDDSESDYAAGSIDLAINGQIISSTGTLTGVAVRDLLVTEFGTTAFVAGSTINGCLLTGSCNTSQVRIDTPNRTDVQLTDNSGLGDGLFGNEPDIDDGEAGDDSDLSSPIEAPNPLFDSRGLSDSDEVDDPVSGSGNPSLYGASDEDVEDCDSSKDSKCKTRTKGDGK